MTRYLAAVLQLLTVVCLCFAPAPRPCLGDGAGHACAAATCACVEACTCRAAHAAERESARHAACGMLPADSHDAMLAACHPPDGPAHFALPTEPGWLLAPDLTPVVWLAPDAAATRTRFLGQAPSRAPPPPPSPPWTSA